MKHVLTDVTRNKITELALPSEELDEERFCALALISNQENEKSTRKKFSETEFLYN
jgi:hypothetical protein